MAQILVKGVSKSYGKETALRDVTVEFADSITTAVVGPSGSGKSTLLQLINGLVRPSSGTVQVHGKPIDYNRLPELRRQIGYAVQGTGLFPHLTVERNITLLARLVGWDAERIRTKAYTENVVDLMVGKIGRLPDRVQRALQALSCLGSSAEVATLSLVQGASEEQVHADLWEAVRLEMIRRSDGSYKFVHDRIHEAAYSLVPEEVRGEVHLRVGRLLAVHTPPDKLGERELTRQADLARLVRLAAELDDGELTCAGFVA